jgi:hypothetical protein
LIANRTSVREWERFSLVDNPDGTISLRAYANGRYVTAASGSPLIASRTAINITEKFQIIY